MSRCSRPSPALRRALLTTAATLALPALAQVQLPSSLPRDFPRDALRGELLIMQPPEARLNDQPARLAPGVRIRGQNNILVLSGALAGQKLPVHYTTDIHGLVKDVWILRPEELARPWPTTRAEAAAWAYDATTRTWTQR
jgi:hypothetical protein